MPVVPHLRDIIRAQVADWPAPVLIVEGDNDKYDAMAASRAAMACSGTVSLELALARLPAVIAYKTNALTAALVRRLIRVKYANLVNLMHGTMAVPELLQENCTPEKLAAAVEILLADSPQRAAQISDLADVAAWLGQGQFIPSERAAEVILSY
jgi:lipid-A-disaccharide synthase